ARARGTDREFDIDRLKHRLVTVTQRDHLAAIPEPEEYEVVYFRLRRADRNYKGRLGVVVMVNGRNLLSEQTGAPEDCGKWILEENDQSVVLHGWCDLKEGRDPEWRELKVLSREDSKKVTMYGDKLGQIAIHTFVEGKPDPDPEKKLRRDTYEQVASE